MHFLEKIIFEKTEKLAKIQKMHKFGKKWKNGKNGKNEQCWKYGQTEEKITIFEAFEFLR